MSDTYAIPTVAERLGIRAGTRTRERRPRPPRHPLFLVTAVGHLAMAAVCTLTGAAAWVVVLNVLGAAFMARYWWRRKTPTGWDLFNGLWVATFTCLALILARLP